MLVGPLRVHVRTRIESGRIRLALLPKKHTTSILLAEENVQVSVRGVNGLYHHNTYTSRSPTNTFFKLLAFASAVFVQLFKVLHPLLGGLKSSFLAFLCL